MTAFMAVARLASSKAKPVASCAYWHLLFFNALAPVGQLIIDWHGYAAFQVMQKLHASPISLDLTSPNATVQHDSGLPALISCAHMLSHTSQLNITFHGHASSLSPVIAAAPQLHHLTLQHHPDYSPATIHSSSDQSASSPQSLASAVPQEISALKHLQSLHLNLFAVMDMSLLQTCTALKVG